MAARRCAAELAAGRVETRLGSATATGMASGSFDHVISVNNVTFWGDVPAGFTELRRVLRPGGTAVVAFHSRNAPSRRARRIDLPEDEAVWLEAAMARIFGLVQRHELPHIVAFVGVHQERQ
jgi:SAM-dependent methyltransferase